MIVVVLMISINFYNIRSKTIIIIDQFINNFIKSQHSSLINEMNNQNKTKKINKNNQKGKQKV